VAWTRSTVAPLVDHTLLRPEATAADIAALCAEGERLGVATVCVSPSQLPVVARGVGVAAVVGFPSGAHRPEVKAAEAARALADGATELDMVIDLGRALAGEWVDVGRDIAAVRAVAAGAVLKVILESALLTPDQLRTACDVAAEAGADFVKTSTGFHPAGGATVEAVALMAATVGDRLGVKASGGIRTAEQAVAMLDAGATRLGLSATLAILTGLPD